ncbi:hypothetical protein E0494_07150 [Marinilabiliaceae bacterium JC040]|nr:hypothetical protein [Marinilabiliaceae bacterium JC040]
MLYIIGNGFDRYHGFSTSYSDFENFMEEWSKSLYYEIHEYWNFNVKDGRWCDFENDLSTFDSSKIYRDCASRIQDPIDKINTCLGLVDKLYEGIKNCFISWIKNIKLDYDSKIILLPILYPKARFITFNYTLTLEEVYYIPKNEIWHIHGSINDNDLIFGHKEKEKIEYSYSDETGMPSNEQEMDEDLNRSAKLPLVKFRKKTDEIIKQNNVKFNKYNDLENIYVLGHSLSDVDLPYFRLLYELNKNAKWNVSFYTEKEKNYLYSQLKKIGIKDLKIKMLQLKDL